MSVNAAFPLCEDVDKGTLHFDLLFYAEDAILLSTPQLYQVLSEMEHSLQVVSLN